MIAEVIVDIAASETDKIFDYLCDEDTIVGSRVRAPFGGKTVAGFVMKIKEQSDVPFEKLKRVLPYPDCLPALTKECLALAEKLAARYRVPKALVLRLFLPTEMRTGKVRELMRNYAELTLPLEEIKLPKSAKNQLAVATYLAEHGKTDCPFLNNAFGNAVSGLEKKGYVKITREQILREPYQGVSGNVAERTLTIDQLRAVRTVKEDERTVQLVHGVTGSVKTEVYLTLIAECLQQGKSKIKYIKEEKITTSDQQDFIDVSI